MEPRATTGELALRVGHDLPVYVSEAAQLGLPGDCPAADAGALGLVTRQACPTTSVSLPSSAWCASSPQ
jgi:hypothetical protein